MTNKEKQLFDLVRSLLGPHLLTKNFTDRPDSPYYGHCFHATVALYKLLGGKAAGYAVWKAVDSEGISHYWLTSPQNVIIDPTVEQYTDYNLAPPYMHGKRTGFRPSHSVDVLIKAINGES